MDALSPIQEVIKLSIPVLDKVPFIRAILGIALVFFAPGFAWSLICFKDISLLLRLVLSVALSVSLVTLTMLALNVALGVKISGGSGLVSISVLTAIPLAIYYGRKYMRKRKEGLSQDSG